MYVYIIYSMYKSWIDCSAAVFLQIDKAVDFNHKRIKKTRCTICAVKPVKVYRLMHALYKAFEILCFI